MGVRPFSAVCFVLCVAFLFAVLSRPHTAAPVEDDSSLSNPSSDTCRSDILNVVAETNKAQLNLQQRTWIATTMFTYSSARVQSQPPVNILVWGLGFDSLLWYAAHCKEIKVGGNLAFLETNEDWIDKVVTVNPHLTAHHLPKSSFETKVASAPEFIGNLHDSLVLPEAVQNTCWDVVLVDAPPGFTENDPGRHEATWWTIQMARRCHEAGHPRDITVFIHDTNRKVETLIFNDMLLQVGEDLGLVKGTVGDLRAVRIRRPAVKA